MKKLQIGSAALCAALGIFLAGCGSNPSVADSTPPKPRIEFVDLQGFDRDLSGSLSAQLPTVDIAFYDPVTPNALPERLQSWMASVEAGGGNIKVTPAPGSITAKDPFLLLTAISTLWSAGSTAAEMARKIQFRSAQTYDANIVLKQNERGQSVVDKVVFTQRKK
jgi:hypothetical protein